MKYLNETDTGHGDTHKIDTDNDATVGIFTESRNTAFRDTHIDYDINMIKTLMIQILNETSGKTYS